MKHIDKTVISKLPPRSKEVMWLDASEENSDAQLKAFINGKWQPVVGSGRSGSTESMIEITYSELKNFRDNSNLSPGYYYRITDYQCTTTQEGTQSAGHQFDVIVRADDVNILNENAFAIEHEDDTYFSNANLSAWELKYCLDNDTNRFAWADPTNGKGVIYYMKDDINNECPYDFKNIQYVFEEGFEYSKWGTTVAVNRNSSLDTEVDGTMYYGYTIKGEVKPYGWADYNCYTKNLVTNASEQLYSAPNGSLLTGGNIVKVNVESFIAYTFDDNGNDATLATQHRCYNNHISPYYYSVYTGSAYINYFILNSIFAKKDLDTKLDFNNNIFGDGCHGIILMDANYNNIFGDGCYNITLMKGDHNTFGNDCYNITFGNNCYNNTFGNDCYNITFGNGCHHTTFGNSCNNITFGNNCYNNTFGTNCYSNTFGSDCNYITFGNECYNTTFGSSGTTQSYYNNIIFESGNHNINLVCSQTTSGTSKCQNILVALGVNNTNITKTITINAVNQTNRTVVRSAADTEITV